MFRSYTDGLARDAIQVDTDTRFEVVEMDEIVFHHEIDDTMLLGNFPCDWEIICGFRWEVPIDGFLMNGGLGAVNFEWPSWLISVNAVAWLSID
jgi:hypothetical protein